MAQNMAQEALVLSPVPVPAPAALPADAAFDAIRQAFLETARGRWFLDEYARRNRNADTAMVLEAVTRIEQALAAQKDDATLPATTEPPASVPAEAIVAAETMAATEAIAAAGAIVAAARDDAMAALAGPALDEALAPSRKCARVIREIAWGLRESGADGRICALLETQVDAINAACDQFASGDLRDAVARAFDHAARRIDGLAAPSGKPAAVTDDGLFDRANAVDTAPATIVVAIEASAAPQAETIAQADPQTVLPEEQDAAAHLHVVATTVEPALPAEAAPAAVTMTETMVETTAAGTTTAESTAATSLGASLIASGIVARPAPARSDPLAPIRRMSQAEKVAFFS
jgi:hypothetical protein